MKSLLITLSLLFLVTTSYADNKELGGKIFNNNCAVCHGQNASGSEGDWREKLADGSYPPPPLNGSAHTWHHSPKQLLWTINNGGTTYRWENACFQRYFERRRENRSIRLSLQPMAGQD